MHLTSNNRKFTLSAYKPRQVLALLLLNPNRPVAVEKLMEELWGGNPPRSSMTTIQTYILLLRKFLTTSLQISSEQVAKTILVTEPAGYTFQIRPGQLDLHDFNDLSLRGRRAMSEGRIAEAADLLRQALCLWRGHPLADVPVGQVLQPKVRGLEEARLVALEQRIDADLRLGRHREVLAELAELTGEHLFDEKLHGHLMVALYRAGRRLEALDIFRRLRTRMIDEVGLEPSSMLYRVQQAVLADSGIEYLSV
ncbi:BTAD domain-containing putative transcriptional regulator [Nocardia sp. NPDC020380]|uniref:AfsR/SARP family transcriptional regulator n=1 Tax=Nocardia sp. NPDC020380 TaxID=3364309 RepID=UPI0037A43D38